VLGTPAPNDKTYNYKQESQKRYSASRVVEPFWFQFVAHDVLTCFVLPHDVDIPLFLV
jgi:hypothetical protein